MTAKPDKKQLRGEADAIGVVELCEAIQKSGYPLEVDLFHVFKEKGMPATLGMRLKVDEGADEVPEIGEVDLVASLKGAVPLDDQKLTHYALSVFTAVKLLHAPAQFVGILGEQPDDSAEALARAHYAGLPSFGHGAHSPAQPTEAHRLFATSGELCDTSGPLHGAPHCPHWAVVSRRQLKGRQDWEAFAKGDTEFYRDMKHLVGARAYWAERLSKLLLGKPKGTSPFTTFVALLLVVGTKEIFVYDPQKRSVRGVPRLVVQQTYQVGARTCQAAIDVVTPAEVPAMIERYLECFTMLGERVKPWDAAMVMLIDTLREKAKRT